MRRPFIAVVLPLAVLVVVSPKKAFAGPPPSVSSKMVREPVTEKLIRLRQEKDPKRKLALVRQLGPIRDARVTVALMELVLSARPEDPLLCYASSLLYQYHIPDIDKISLTAIDWTLCRQWWEKHEAEVRRRAKQMP